MISDSHNDFLTHYKLFGQKKKYIESLQDKAFVNAAFWTTESDNIVNKLQSYRQMINKFSDGNLLLSIEDGTFVNENNYNSLIDNRVFSCGLTWNYDNIYAGGAEGKGDLTKRGKNLISRLESDNVIIDISHLNHKSIDSVIDVSNQPIFCSHSNIYALCNVPRNLFDRHLKVIFATNGFLGINFVDYFLSYGYNTPNDIVRHIDYFVQKYGAKNIGFGTDFFGSDHLVIDSYKVIQEQLSDKLHKLGYCYQDIQNIFFDNFYNFANNHYNFDKVID